ncbi:hypothetical protein ACHAW5_009287 [Stephanodiscus triporus]|uniref:Uncharacterized protein n=1 Tax=Stephanodiscus triporus TaxID=2934178 RepID=A0ABD3NT84_9STRA
MTKTIQRRAITIALLTVAARSLWPIDANPLLFFYDIYVTRRIAGGGSGVVEGDDDGMMSSRRAFPPGSAPALEGKTAWITGASSGIGAELAIQLARAGIGRLVLSGRRRGELESVARMCREASASASASGGRGTGARPVVRTSVVAFDMSGGPDVLDSAVSDALRDAPSIDVLVLNAGRYQCQPAMDADLDALLPELMRINFESPVLLARRLMREDRWREDGRGHVVVVSSLLGRGTTALNSVYSASKHALGAYFLTLAAEERSWLRVDVVLPGPVDTGLWRGTSSSAPAIGLPPLHADDRSKMSVRRCAQLIISGMIGPNSLFYETWVTNNPGLLWVYLASYEPNTFRLLTNIVGSLRLDIWRKRGEDALYLPTLLLHLWECIKEWFRRLLISHL